MNVLFLARSTLFSVYGGDTVQIQSTARYLRKIGVNVDIKLANEQIDYTRYDLMHVFNVIRPADVLTHISASKLPFVLSTIFVDYNEYNAHHARGIVAMLNKIFSNGQLEYTKAIARWIKNGERINSLQYLLWGHNRSVRHMASSADHLLPNSQSEYDRFIATYNVRSPYTVVYNGVDPEVFDASQVVESPHRDKHQVLCVSRIEGKKNHLNLIRALNNTEFRLKIIGKPAPNHQAYYDLCRKEAARNITFEGFMPQEELVSHYLSSKVHVLPSWNETCGLSSLEAAWHGCNLVITDKGDTNEYFGNNAWYCDPARPDSIYNAISQAAQAPWATDIKEKIVTTYNWHHAAVQTLSVYETVLKKVFKAAQTEENESPEGYINNLSPLKTGSL